PTAGVCDQRNGGQVLNCTAAIPNRSCPLWVKSRHSAAQRRCPLYPPKRTLLERVEMSAFLPKADSFGAAKRIVIRSPRRRAGEQRWRYGKSESPGGLKVDDKLEFCRLLNG